MLSKRVYDLRPGNMVSRMCFVGGHDYCLALVIAVVAEDMSFTHVTFLTPHGRVLTDRLQARRPIQVMEDT